MALSISACVVVPQTDYSQKYKCELSSDKKVLKLVNLLENDTSFYAWTDETLALISVPTSAILSASYVLVNNVYHIGERTIKCG
ncbi:hypothetical protein [Glaciecola sp. SC05]|uniref:hypothetical protein n=1 Tax=Glaciecola sp. SC05 TaxID=1987355 RepID=UPI003529AC8B